MKTVAVNIPLVVDSVIQPPVKLWPGGEGALIAEASDFAGATVTLQCRLPNTAAYVSTSTTLTSNGLALFSLPMAWLQVTVTGGAPTALNCSAQVAPANVN
jgi:hypothetical protein